MRKPEMLPPAEIRATILALIEAHHGATRRELPVAVSRVFGFKSTGTQLRATIEAPLAALLHQRAVEDNEGMLKVIK